MENDFNIEQQTQTGPIEVKVVFSTNSDSVGLRVLATGQTAESIAANKALTLTHGRLFYIPVNTEANSDTYSVIKIPSKMAGKIDVRYIKDGVACLMPIENFTIIKNDQLIAYLL